MTEPPSMPRPSVPQPGYGPPAYTPQPPYPYYGPPPQPWGPPPRPVSPGGAPLADFGTRLLAYLIDTAILAAVALVIAVPAMLWFFAEQMPQFEKYAAVQPGVAPEPGAFFTELFLPLLLLEAGLFGVLLIVYYFYCVEMMHRSGQTVGKKAMKIRVAPLDPAARLTRGAAAKRYLVQYVAGSLVPFFSYLDGFWQLWDKPYLQTLHDKAARTVVIKLGP